MRLIDADKLREWFETERPLSVQRMVEAVDAAPTIGCETCEYHEDASCLHSGMVTYSPDGSEGFGFKPDPDFGCSLYEPKEQT